MLIQLLFLIFTIIIIARDKFHYMASAACDFNADINKNYTITRYIYILIFYFFIFFFIIIFNNIFSIRATTLLIDDDFLNIKSALENSVRAIQFDKEKPDE